MIGKVVDKLVILQSDRGLGTKHETNCSLACPINVPVIIVCEYPFALADKRV